MSMNQVKDMILDEDHLPTLLLEREPESFLFYDKQNIIQDYKLAFIADKELSIDSNFIIFYLNTINTLLNKIKNSVI